MPRSSAAAVVTALINAAVNPLLELMVNRGGFQPLSAVAANLVITSIVMCVLVAVFSHRGAGHGLRWGVAAAAAISATAVLLAGFGAAGTTLSVLLLVKAVYCGCLAYLVAR